MFLTPQSQAQHLYYVIPSCLLLIIPLLSLLLVLFVAGFTSRAFPNLNRLGIRPTSRRISLFSSFAFSSLALLTLLVGAFGLASVKHRDALAQSESLVLTLLRLALGVIVIFFLGESISPSTIHGFKLWIYLVAFSSLLLCATVLSLISPFVESIPPLLPPLLYLLLATLTLPLIVYTLLTISDQVSLSSPPIQLDFILSSPSRRKRAFSLSDVHVNPGSFSPPEINPQTTYLMHKLTRLFWIGILISQFCALLTLALDICILVQKSPRGLGWPHLTDRLGDGDLGAKCNSVIILRSFEALFLVGWIGCVMFGLLLHVFDIPQKNIVKTSPGSSPSSSRDSSFINVTPRSPSFIAEPPQPSSEYPLFSSPTIRAVPAALRRPITLYLSSFRSSHAHPVSPPRTADDPLGTLNDPFALSQPIDWPIHGAQKAEKYEGAHQTRMSAWGNLVLPSPITSNSLAPIEEQQNGGPARTPSRGKKGGEGGGNYVNLEGGGDGGGVEEALLAQRLLRKLERVAGSLGKNSRRPGMGGSRRGKPGS